MEFSLNYLANLINSMDIGYEYTLTGQLLDRAVEKDELIFNWLNGLTHVEIVEVKALLNTNGKKIYSHYFKLD
jgi:hypothetical protein